MYEWGTHSVVQHSKVDKKQWLYSSKQCVCVCVYARACVCALVCACMFLTSSADCMTTMDPFPEETATVASEAPTQ